MWFRFGEFRQTLFTLVVVSLQVSAVLPEIDAVESSWLFNSFEVWRDYLYLIGLLHNVLHVDEMVEDLNFLQVL